MKFTQDAASFPVGVRSNSSVQELNLGTKVVVGDGREFRYVKAGATALVAGKVYDSPAQSTDNANIAVVLGTAGATQITVTLGSTAATVNQYAGGQVIINDEDGQGFTYSIKSHPAADAAASLVLTLEDDEPIVTALTTSSQATLVANVYNGVIIHASTETGIPVGVAVTNITAAQYGWIQTRGPVSCLCGATTAIGQSVAASDTTAGAYEIGDGILPVIGYAVTAGVATEYNVIYLNM